MGIGTINEKDRKVLRELSKKYIEIANKPEMAERKQLWKDLHDLKPQRPMILFEPFSVDGYLRDYTFQCEDELLQNVERRMMFLIRQYEQLEDDIVLEPYFRVAWWGPNMRTTGTDFGEIKIVEHGAKEASLAFLSNFPIKTPDDIKKLTPREFTIDRKPTLDFKEKLEDIFGDILPVRVGNFDNFLLNLGDQPFTGNNFIGLTWDIFKLIGAENMMIWAYDYPDALHELCRFLTDDKQRFFQFMLDEKLFDFNTDNQFAGPSSYGYVSELPDCNSKKEIELKDLWTWPESQETEVVSPEMCSEFYHPYIGEIANQFGLSYYGCCEGVHEKFEVITKHIRNIRTVSVSGWSDQKRVGELLGNKYVYSRKPIPAYISSPTVNWDLIEKEAKETKSATKDGCLEIIFRDVYTSRCTPQRILEYIRLWKKIIGF